MYAPDFQHIAIHGLSCCKRPRMTTRNAVFHIAFCRLSGFIRKPFGWYIKVYPVPEGGEWRVGLCGGGFLRLCGMSVYPNNRITLNLTTVNAVRPLRGRYYLRIHTASSASLHMRLSNVGPLRGPATHCCHPKGLRMNPFEPCKVIKNQRHETLVCACFFSYCCAQRNLLTIRGLRFVL